MPLEEEIMSGVVRGSAVIVGLVEGLSDAYETRNKATTYENDDNNDIVNVFNDTARRATFNAQSCEVLFASLLTVVPYKRPA